MSMKTSTFHVCGCDTSFLSFPSLQMPLPGLEMLCKRSPVFKCEASKQRSSVAPSDCTAEQPLTCKGMPSERPEWVRAIMPSTLATWQAVTSLTPYWRMMFLHSSRLETRDGRRGVRVSHSKTKYCWLRVEPHGARTAALLYWAVYKYKVHGNHGDGRSINRSRKLETDRSQTIRKNRVFAAPLVGSKAPFSIWENWLLFQATFL